MYRIWINVISTVLLFLNFFTISEAVLAGTLAKCENEGEIIKLELVSGNPCIQCFCRNGMVVCDVQKCPPMQCPLEDIINVPGDCCPKCKSGKQCEMEGKNYEHGEKWMTGCSSCECLNGDTRCRVNTCEPQTIQCPLNFQWATPPGECCPKCIEREAVCSVFGDPHYKTFDGRMFDFQGNCKYTLTKLCDAEHLFSVRVTNHVRMYHNYAWTKMAAIQLNRTRIFMEQRMVVKIKKREVDLPYHTKNFNIVIEDRMIVLRTIDGIKIIWDGDSYLEVTVPVTMRNKLCGLCGNYNGDPNDDFLGKKGDKFLKPTDFGNQWRVGSKHTCRIPERAKKPSPCLGSFSDKLLAHHECSILFTPVFEKCREAVPVRPYYKACVTDVCDCPSSMQCSCEALTAYAKACARYNIVTNWKTPNLCGTPKCIYGSRYQTCMSGCARTCENPVADVNCNKPCVPGCECAPGLVLHNHRCVKVTRCKRLLEKAKRKKH